MRFPVEIVRRMREAVGRDFIIIYRLSMLDLVEDGQTWDEIVALAKAVEAAGATLINTGIGWHEARVPTIVTSVPRAAFTWVTRRAARARSRSRWSPPTASTCPRWPSRSWPQGDADMVSMARPLLADADWVAQGGDRARPTRSTPASPATRPASTTSSRTRPRSCLVNPRACHETELVIAPTDDAASGSRSSAPGRRASPAPTTLAERGHRVTLFEAADAIGGQFNMAKRIPGKEEFHETLRYFERRIEVTGVDAAAGHARRRRGAGASGVRRGGARHRASIRAIPRIPGIDHPKVLSYIDVLARGRVPGGAWR